MSDIITGSLSEIVQITGSLASMVEISGELTTPEIIRPEAYAGEYRVTPSMASQVLPTNGLYMADNITIDPIPSNYGLITWNGSTLTVS